MTNIKTSGIKQASFLFVKALAPWAIVMGVPAMQMYVPTSESD